MSRDVRIPSAAFRDLMQEKHQSDAELSEAIGVSRTTLRRWRLGEVAPRISEVKTTVDHFEELWGRINKRVELLLLALEESDEPSDIAAWAVDRAEPWNPIGGLYFLVKGDQVVYIGRSSDLHKRVGEHYAQDKVDFDRVALLEIEDYEQRCRVERVYLKAVNPKHNSVRGI